MRKRALHGFWGPELQRNAVLSPYELPDSSRGFLIFERETREIGYSGQIAAPYTVVNRSGYWIYANLLGLV
jgi:hypothetical protein